MGSVLHGYDENSGWGTVCIVVTGTKTAHSTFPDFALMLQPLPFTWKSLTEGDPTSLPETYAYRELETPPVDIRVNRQGILVTDYTGTQILQFLYFEDGFPGYGMALSDMGNSRRVSIGADGSVVFVAEVSGEILLCRWAFGTEEITCVAVLDRAPEAIAFSNDGRRLAVLRYSSQGWQARAWALPEGKSLGEYTWDSIYSGTLSDFSFSDDGTRLCLTMDVFAQSGTDFTDGTSWELPPIG